MLLTGVALGLGLAFSGAGQRADQDRRRRTDHRAERHLRRAAQERRRAGGRRHQRRRRHHGPEDRAVGRRRRVRSEAGRLGRQQVRRRRRQVGRRPLQLRRLDPGLGGLPGSRHHPDHAGLDEPALHRARTCGTPSAPAAATTSRARSPAPISPSKFKGKKVAIVHDKTPYGKGLADETQKAMNGKGLKEVMYEGVNTGEKDYSALVSKLKQAQRRRRLFRRPAHRSRPDHPPDARPGRQGADDVGRRHRLGRSSCRSPVPAPRAR